MKLKGCTGLPILWLILLLGLRAMAVEPELQTQNFAGFLGLPVKPQMEVLKSKHRRAQILSQWVIKKLEAEHVNVAIITREGSPLVHLLLRWVNI